MKIKNSKIKAVLLVSIAIIIALVTLLLTSNSVSAITEGAINAYRRGTTEITWSYEPESYIIGNTTFKVSLYISNASKVWGWGIDNITWNPSVVNLTRITEGAYLNNDYSTICLTGVIDNGNGIMLRGIAAAISDGTGLYSSLDQGELCYLTFTIVGIGNADITISGISISDSENPPIYQTVTQSTVTVLA